MKKRKNNLPTGVISRTNNGNTYYYVAISINGKKTTLGGFINIEKAAKKYQELRAKYPVTKRQKSKKSILSYKRKNIKGIDINDLHIPEKMPKGVRIQRHKNKVYIRMNIQVNGKRYYFGGFKTIEEAGQRFEEIRAKFPSQKSH